MLCSLSEGFDGRNVHWLGSYNKKRVSIQGRLLIPGSNWRPIIKSVLVEICLFQKISFLLSQVLHKNFPAQAGTNTSPDCARQLCYMILCDYCGAGARS
jgi:hypothetical protein